MGGLPYIKIYFFLNTYNTESKMFINLTKIFLDPQQNFKKEGMQKSGFFIEIIFCRITFQSQCMVI